HGGTWAARSARIQLQLGAGGSAGWIADGQRLLRSSVRTSGGRIPLVGLAFTIPGWRFVAGGWAGQLLAPSCKPAVSANQSRKASGPAAVAGSPVAPSAQRLTGDGGAHGGECRILHLQRVRAELRHQPSATFGPHHLARRACRFGLPTRGVADIR